MDKTMTTTKTFLKTDYVNHACAVFEGFYESGLYNSDTLYNMTYNDRGSTTTDADGNEIPILKDNEEYDFVEDGWSKFQEDVCKQAVAILDELATEYKDEDKLIIKNLELHGINSPKYYNFETDKLHIDLEVDVQALQEFCFDKFSNDFNRYLNDNFTSYDGFMSFIDNNLNDFKSTYYSHGEPQDRIDSREGNVMIEFYLLTCIYETTELNTVESISDDDYRYHCRLWEYANDCIWDYIAPTEV